MAVYVLPMLPFSAGLHPRYWAVPLKLQQVREGEAAAAAGRPPPDFPLIPGKVSRQEENKKSKVIREEEAKKSKVSVRGGSGGGSSLPRLKPQPLIRRRIKAERAAPPRSDAELGQGDGVACVAAGTAQTPTEAHRGERAAGGMLAVVKGRIVKPRRGLVHPPLLLAEEDEGPGDNLGVRRKSTAVTEHRLSAQQQSTGLHDADAAARNKPPAYVHVKQNVWVSLPRPK
jgi:hypothetical protein